MQHRVPEVAPPQNPIPTSLHACQVCSQRFSSLLTLLHIAIMCLPERKCVEIEVTGGKNKCNLGLVRKSFHSPLPSGSISQPKAEVASDGGGCLSQEEGLCPPVAPLCPCLPIQTCGAPEGMEVLLWEAPAPLCRGSSLSTRVSQVKVPPSTAWELAR